MLHNAASMRGLRTALAVGAMVAAASSAVSTVSAEETDQRTNEADGALESESPEALIAEGIEHRRRREDTLARSAFERAWALGGAPRALAQLALAEQALGFWREAHEHLLEALEHVDDPWISAQKKTLALALKEISSHLGTVELSCTVDGAEVRIDGRLVGHTPLVMPLMLVAGKSVVEVRADGYFDMARQVQVDAGGISRVNFSLTPITPPAPMLAGAAEPALPSALRFDASAARDTLTPRAAPPPAQAPPDGGESTRELLTYASAGLAALGAAIGITGYVIREVNVRLYNDEARCSRDLGTPRSLECESEFAAWQRGEVMAIAGAATAGVFGLTAAYLWWTRPAVADAHGGLSCAVGAGSVSCGGVF